MLMCLICDAFPDEIMQVKNSEPVAIEAMLHNNPDGKLYTCPSRQGTLSGTLRASCSLRNPAFSLVGQGRVTIANL